MSQLVGPRHWQETQSFAHRSLSQLTRSAPGSVLHGFLQTISLSSLINWGAPSCFIATSLRFMVFRPHKYIIICWTIGRSRKKRLYIPRNPQEKWFGGSGNRTEEPGSQGCGVDQKHGTIEQLVEILHLPSNGKSYAWSFVCQEYCSTPIWVYSNKKNMEPKKGFRQERRFLSKADGCLRSMLICRGIIINFEGTGSCWKGTTKAQTLFVGIPLF